MMSALSERNRDTPVSHANPLRYQLEDITASLESLRGTQKALESAVKSERHTLHDINRQIQTLMGKKESMERSITEKESKMESLARNIKEAEATYMKLLESSQTLAAFVKKECAEYGSVMPLTPSKIRTPYDTHE